MSTKQDRVAPRTATDLERKYNFGERFSEILGLIDDTRKDVDSTSSELRDEILEQSTSIRRDTESIVSNATSQIQQELSSDIDGVESELVTVKKSVESKLDADAFSVEIRKEISNGVSLECGYTFDSNGLNISQSGSEIQNLINNDGMYVNRGTENVLTANSKGVVAQDLHAKTWLCIGNNSRIEDYGVLRTGCFWVGD